MIEMMRLLRDAALMRMGASEIERLRGEIEQLTRAASPPAAPATCPECGGCAVCLGGGVLRRYEPGSGIGEAVPCPRCRAGEFPATRRGRG